MKRAPKRPKVRTTIYLEPDMHRALKIYAARIGADMSGVIEKLLRKAGINHKGEP